MRVYYAQNREDLLIKSFFPDVDRGFYIDVGANDPVIDSVTKIFYDSGWSGINIEPIEKHARDLKAQRSRDITLQIGISDKPGKLQFRQYLDGDGLSTFDTTMQANYEADKEQPTENFKDHSVSVKTLSEVITENKVGHIHFMKIDVEGFEYEVINGYDWKDPRPEMLCIEAHHIVKDWRPVLKNKSYNLVFFDGINNYYLADEAMKRLEYFNYPKAVFAGNPVYSPSFSEIENNLSAEFRSQKQALMKNIKDQEQQVAQLNQQQRDVRFLSIRLAEEVQARLNKRALGVKSSASLSYKKDPSLAAALGVKTSKQEKVDFIHKKDRQNIHSARPKIGGQFGVLFWKVAARTFRLSVMILKKLSKGLR